MIAPAVGMRAALAVAVLVLGSSGCGTYYWYHPNVPPEIAQRDGDECREQARQIATWELMDDDPFWWSFGRRRRGAWGPMTSGLAIEQDLFDRCMRAKGYALVKEPTPPRSSGP